MDTTTATQTITDTTAVHTMPQFGVFEQLANYGALGVVALAVGALVWFLIKKNLEEKDRMQAKIDELERELRNRK